MIFGVILIVVGVVWFAQTIGYFDSTVWSFVLPWMLVYVGMTYLYASRNNSCLICHLVDKQGIKEKVNNKVARKKKK